MILELSAHGQLALNQWGMGKGWSRGQPVRARKGHKTFQVKPLGTSSNQIPSPKITFSHDAPMSKSSLKSLPSMGQGYSSAAQHLPSKLENLSLIPGTKQTNKLCLQVHKALWGHLDANHNMCGLQLSWTISIPVSVCICVLTG